MVVLSGYIPPEDNFNRIVHGRNVDIIITWCILIFILLKETWEISLYLFSDWTKIVLISTYVECTFLKHGLMEKLIRFLCNISIAGRWHDKIDQYNFLEAFNYKPTVYNLLYYLTLGLFSKATDGVKSNGKIDVPKEVKKAVIKSLHLLELDKGFLPSHMPSLERNNVSVEISQMCELNTCSQVILVWHIATSFCEIELCRQYNAYLAESELPSLWSSLKHFCFLLKNMNCCSYHEPSLVKQERLDGELRANFIVANSLSRYCAHLLVNKPKLMPENIFVGAEIFRNTVCEACVVLKGCDTLQTMYKRLMKEGQRNIMSDKEKTIVRLSAKLGKELIETLDEAARWKVLAEVWADLLVYMAPNSNVDAQKKCLETGGEFITHVWALLSHAGILENTFVNQVENSDEECLP
ncbi:hypothetical protein LUZ63_000621 [Rhynchospora breviuscula]|uniref:DUF4220 domain-containing protein n=1 Tax=Rhynchospora breviuscula TaxID=2022672 RepID=A0A9Q0HW94_9POAL|nr:hypothetical protein LUZ63_000621 [Rhynchospora breviuscula]